MGSTPTASTSLRQGFGWQASIKAFGWARWPFAVGILSISTDVRRPIAPWLANRMFLYHDFLLLSRTDYPYAGYNDRRLRNMEGLYHSPDAIHLDDDLLCKMYDTLLWIPTYLPHNRMKRFRGLDYCGMNVIKTNGAPIARRIFEGWRIIFSNAPEKMKLIGLPTWIEGDPSHTITREKLRYDRDEVLGQLDRLISALEQVQQSNGKLYILHMGI